MVAAVTSETPPTGECSDFEQKYEKLPISDILNRIIKDNCVSSSVGLEVDGLKSKRLTAVQALTRNDIVAELFAKIDSTVIVYEQEDLHAESTLSLHACCLALRKPSDCIRPATSDA